MSDGFRLIVTEKPSVARDIGRALGVPRSGSGSLQGDGVRITWAFGHMVELAEPHEYDPNLKRWRLDDLPIRPDRFRLRPRSSHDSGTREQWEAIRALMTDPNLAEVVNACDAGREGELIFAYIREMTGCTAPIRRLWISSLTDNAIRKGFENLRAGESFGNLEAAARCRSEADWLVGLNATRAMTLRGREAGGDALLSVGRVQTPTLALLCRRENEIESFAARPFWQVKATLATDAGPWEALWTEGQGDSRRDRLDIREAAQEILSRVEGRPGTVTHVERKEQKEAPPLLHDLTALQKEANRRHGTSARETLDLAQSLYERHKLLTYPRTDSSHLSEDQRTVVRDRIEGVAFGPYADFAGRILAGHPEEAGRRIFDDTEVGDHHAIVPTGVPAESLPLSADEKRIYDLVVRRFLAAFGPPARFAAAVVEATIGNDCFRARGRTRLDAGWQEIEPPARKKKEILLPAVEEGEAIEVRRLELHEGKTQAPHRFTEATLLAGMERAGSKLDDEELKRALKRGGLGTPATRAAIIETLLARGFVVREKRNLLPTPRGRALVAVLPVEALSSPALTGRWEARLAAMAEGEDRREEFMAAIHEFTAEVVAAISAAEIPAEPLRALSASTDRSAEPIGTCPRCGEPVRPGRRGWSCDGCPVRIPSKVADRDVSLRMARQILTEGATRPVKGFRARTGRRFTAALILEEDGRIGFSFPPGEELGSCPACGKPVRRRGRVYSCDTGRTCPFVVFEETAGSTIVEEAVRELLERGRSARLEGLVRRDGTNFDGALAWQSGRVEVVTVDAREEAGPVGTCPACGESVAFATGRWRCVGCAFNLPGEVMSRPIRPSEAADLLRNRRTRRLHGFRQKGGAPCKAALFLEEGNRVQVDFRKPEHPDPLPIPPGGPPPAFGERVDCPVCLVRGVLDPGYVVAGREAWGCSEWEGGCPLRLPFVVLERRLEPDEARRFFGKARATRYLTGFSLNEEGPPRRRLVVDSEAKLGYRIEAPAAGKRKSHR